jgi:beta-glucosidase
LKEFLFHHQYRIPLPLQAEKGKRMKDIHALLAQMTLEEKVGQLIQIGTNSFGAEAELTGPAQDWGMTAEEMARVGSCLNGVGAKRIRVIQERHLQEDHNRIPLLFMFDVIHGFRTVYPIGPAMAGSFDPALLYECAEMAAREAAAAGIHVTFSPMVDLARDPRWGRVM